MDIDSGTTTQRVDSLWFEDGNIIIRAQTSLFRLSRGILMRQSPIFADMFVIPQPPDAETMYSCPVAEIPDAAEDATVFFRALFDSSFFEAYPASTTFKIISGILRLSTKYEAGHLRRRALVHLSSAYPMSLAQSDAKALGPDLPLWQRPSWVFHSSNTLPVIRLAREIEAEWILPSAFYFLAHFFTPAAFVRAVQDDPLSDSDRFSFLKGSHLQSLAAINIVRFLWAPSVVHDCIQRESCMETKLDAMDCVRADFPVYSSVPLAMWAPEDWDRLAELCSVCDKLLREVHKQAREEFWDGLPAMYDLPPWDKLQEMKKAAIGEH
ncbi:hypothetical protein C8R43DRAFT_994508 [Mycena crocata]|nr:hypothetical protein C8R43DRAFT_994508 [Mycena crocata]